MAMSPAQLDVFDRAPDVRPSSWPLMLMQQATLRMSVRYFM